MIGRCNLIVGKKYRVEFLPPGLRVNRTAVMTLLAVNGDQTIWDDRPHNGNVAMAMDKISRVLSVDDCVPHSRIRKVIRGGYQGM